MEREQSCDIRSSLLVDTQVIICRDRAFRPDEFSEPNKNHVCPFCPGNEKLTPLPELIRIPNGNGNWEVRGVPNKFPAAKIEGISEFVVSDSVAGAIHNAHGAHEVIIMTPSHAEDLSDFPFWRWQFIFQAATARIDSLYGDKQIRFVQFFINHGYLAGASLNHPHAQLICLPIIPEKIKRRLARTERYLSDHGHSVFDTLLERSKQEQRIICQEYGFICLAPYESKFPYEMWILPMVRKSRLTDSVADFEGLGRILNDVLRRLKSANDGKTPSLNITIDEAPPNFYNQPDAFYCWRLRILPRLTRPAGFELATGLYINPLSPEQAAEKLRNA